MTDKQELTEKSDQPSNDLQETLIITDPAVVPVLFHAKKQLQKNCKSLFLQVFCK